MFCVGGKLQGPPEDCGGIPGYYNLLEAIRDPAHEEHEDMLDWVGGEFNPEAFSVGEVNRRPAPLQRWWAKTWNRVRPTADWVFLPPPTHAYRKLTE
jgi:hypothetical protein